MAPFDMSAASADAAPADGATQIDPLAFETTAVFTLQLFHAADQEGGVAALDDAARFSAVLNALRAQDVGADATLTLSSGDAYIPGVFAGASATAFGGVFRGDILINNALGFEAIAFGNHEFDLGTAIVRDLIAGDAGFEGAQFTYLSSNLDFSTDANLADLVVEGGQAPQANAIASSVVIEKGGELIGVVGATTPILRSISSPGGVTVNPSPFGGVPTDAELDALAAVIQAEVDALLAANPAMNKVVLLAHMQQIAIEEALAERLEHVDIIVAGGSNTRLFDEDDRVRDGDTAQGAYPVIKTGADGRPVAVVNTDGNYKYVGRLVIDFDENGVIVPESYDAAVSGAYATDAQGVAELDAAGLVDPTVQAIVDELREVIVAQDGNFFGITEVFLNGGRPAVRQQETNLGNLTADANLDAGRKAAAALGEDAPVVMSIKNGGGVRASIGEIVTPAGGTTPEFLPPEGNELAGRPEGGISQTAIQNALAFNNNLALITVTKAELVALLEHGVAASTPTNEQGRFPQVAGVEFSFDLTRDPGDRIVSAALVDEDGVPYEALVRDGQIVGDADAAFRIVTLGFLATGGDGYPFPSGASANLTILESTGERTGVATFANDGTEQDALAEYLFENFSETPYAEADTGRELDERIQNLAFRADAVFDGFVEAPVGGLVISEIVEGSSNNKAVELTNFTGEDIDLAAEGYQIRYYFNGSTTAGRTIALDGVVADGDAFVLANGNAVEAILGVADQTDPSTSWFNGDDAIALVKVEDGAVTFVDVFGQIGGRENWNTNVTLRRKDGITTGDDNPADAFSPTAEWDSFPQDTFDGLGVPAGGGEPVDPEEPPVVTIDDDRTLISAIQGTGDVSPLVGRTVVVEAIVTGDFQNGDGDAARNLGGFFLQQEFADFDGEDATSEGIFVLDQDIALLDVNEGDRVRVLGEVIERFGKTTVVAREIRVEQAGAVEDVRTLAVETTLPGRDGREALESMLLRFSEDLTFSESFNFEQFGELTLSSGGTLQQFTQNSLPSVEGFAAAEQERLDRTILIEDGLPGRRADGDPILLPDGSTIDTASGIRMGQSLTDLYAIMDYDFGQHRLRVPEAITLEFDEASNPRPETPDDVGGRLKVASYNVLNYFTTIGSRGAEDFVDEFGRTEFERQQLKIVEAIVRMEADVLGLVEIENNGTAVADLVSAVNARLGEDRYAFVDTGVLGTDAITQAFIYNQQTVVTYGDWAALTDSAFTNPLSATQQNRPALAVTFEEIATGEKFTAAVNHLKSKGSSTGAPEDANQNDGQGASNATRALAAAELAAWLSTDPTGSGDEDFLILGDLNAYGMEDPIRVLVEAGYTDLARAFVGDDVYSYRFSGQLGTLDYAMANGSLLGQVTGATSWNINSDEPVIYDYNVDSTFNLSILRPAGLFDGSSPAANSDHDPIIIGLDLTSEPEVNVVAGTPGSDRLVGTDGVDLIIGGAGNNVLTGGGEADVFVFGEELANGRRELNQITDYEAGVDMIDLGGFEVVSFRETRAAVFLTVGEDGDQIIVRGVQDFDQIQFVDNLLVA